VKPLKILVTGANRGLGIEFVRQYLKSGKNVVATCRRPDEAINLKKLHEKYVNSLKIVKLNVTNQTSIDESYHEVKNSITAIDILINNAGLFSGGKSRYYALGKLYTENIVEVFSTNSIAPVLIMERYLPLLKKGNNPKVINISSKMGSVSLKTSTSTYSYDASKAALNMFTKALSNQIKKEKIAILALHPGWVQTRMGTDRAPLTPEKSIGGMTKVIDSVTMKDTGKFLDWEGRGVPW
jgi:NAD(P)-dependent dehydrogenase (short-subunit alcohol dehydrogenase family)